MIIALTPACPVAELCAWAGRDQTGGRLPCPAGRGSPPASEKDGHRWDPNNLRARRLLTWAVIGAQAVQKFGGARPARPHLLLCPLLLAAAHSPLELAEHTDPQRRSVNQAAALPPSSTARVDRRCTRRCIGPCLTLEQKINGRLLGTTFARPPETPHHLVPSTSSAGHTLLSHCLTTASTPAHRSQHS